jgi:hypothetical protein
VIGTYAAALAVCGASLTIGQAAIVLCGPRRWSWLSPAVGLALLCAICWGTVRLPGDGTISAALVLILTIAALIFLWGRAEGRGEELQAGLAVALPALAVASLPFLVEGHFGILGTGFNPDMSQHLLAGDRLADGVDSQLLTQGYPLGPHSVAVALDKGLGIGLVQGFSGLTVAAAVLAPLTALAAFADQPPVRRTAAALFVGLPYLVASYFAQGAFKETIQALLILAFVLSLRESSRNPAWCDQPLRFVPAALIAVGSVYVYSFPGLVWLAGTAAIWAFVELTWAKYASPAGGVEVRVSSRARRPVFRPSGPAGETAAAGEKPSARLDTLTSRTGSAGRRELALAFAVFLVGVLPELGRMIEFQRFETFDPTGPGLGNLFGQLSPFEALGIWPSGDFRLAPGDGAAPAVVYYLGAAFAAVLLLYGLFSCWRRRESAVVAGLLAAVGIYVAARVGGTPYTAAKALGVAAPLVSLAILRAALGDVEGPWRVSREMDGKVATGRFRGTALGWLAAVYILAAAACSLLAFANAPVGPSDYSPQLTGLRPLIASGSTLVLAPEHLIEEEQGARYIAWELRGGRVCIESQGAAGGAAPAGIRFVVTFEPEGRRPFRDLVLRRRAGPYVLWKRRGVVSGPGPCPLIAARQSQAPNEG